MKNREMLYWTIGGVVLALLGLYAATHAGGGSSSSSDGGGGSTPSSGISASSLLSEVNSANADAAAVESARLSAVSSYAIAAANNQTSAFENLTNNATAQLATVENAGSSRYAAGLEAHAAEFAAHENALTSQFEAAQQTQVSLAGISAAHDIAHFESDNAVTVARIQHGSSFGNFLNGLVGAASSFFSGGGLNLFRSSGSSATASNAQQTPPPPAPVLFA